MSIRPVDVVILFLVVVSGVLGGLYVSSTLDGPDAKASSSAR